MSKMLLPTELDTAMSPRPLRATITLVMRSGMDVPAARMVRPIISSEMLNVSPTYMRSDQSSECIEATQMENGLNVFLSRTDLRHDLDITVYSVV